MSSTDRRAGFTLVELLLATVLAGLFAIVLFNFINSQSRFVKAQSAREEVGQNLRGALEILASELRSVPGGAITAADTVTLEFRLPRVWGVYCGVAGGRHHVVFPAGSATATNMDAFPDDFTAGNGWGLAVDSAGSNQFWAAAITDSVRVTTGPCVSTLGATLVSATAPVPVAVAFGVGGGIGAAVPRSHAFVYHTVRYDRAAGGSVPGTWLRRSQALDGSNPQPLAGPLQTTGTGLRFSYFCNGAPIDPSTPANRAKITTVQVIMGMQSRASTQSVLQSETDTLTVHLRNSGTISAC